MLILWSNVQYKNIRTTVLKSRSISASTTCDYSFIHTICKYLWHGITWKLTLRIPLTNGVARSCHECDHVTFPWISYDVCNFLIEILKFKQAIQMTFGRNKCDKRTAKNLKTRISHAIKVIKRLNNFSYQKVSPMHKFISCKKIENNM